MSTTQHSNDQTYGQTALGLGLVTDAQLQDGVKIQAALRQMGLEEPLGAILTKKGYITAQGHSAVLKKLGVQMSPIPGYTILAKIGQGGMGVVYKALQTSVNRTVAIKILGGNATKDKTFVARFLQEAQSAANLNHKNLISAIDVGVSNGIYYFVMEFVTGKSCREILNAAKGPIPEATALQVAMQMAEVLDHIHSHQMVHRDIKPENILLTGDGIVKLCDLGLAKSTTSAEQSLTQEGLAVGTPYFMSPEQIRGDKDVDIRADLYSLGATLFFLLTGRHPFEGKSAAETMSMHLKEAVPDPRKLNPQIREDFGWVILKLMAKDRAQRYQTPGELLEDLKKIKDGSTPALARQHAARVQLHQKAHPTQRTTVHHKPAPIWPYVAAGATVVAAGVVLFVLLSRPQKERVVVVERTSAPLAAAAPVKESPKDDPKKSGEAAALYSAADQLMKQEKWREALADLRKLSREYEALEYTRGHAADIGERVGTCEGKIKEQESAKNRQLDDARQALREGRWSEAQAAFQLLTKSGHPEYQQDLDRCRRELEAAAAIKEIESARDGGRWLEVLTKSLALGQRSKEHRLETVDQRQGELTAWFIKAQQENEAGRTLNEAHSAAQATNWKQVQKLLVDLEKYRDTETYRQKESELKDLRTRYAMANEAAADAEASQAWIPAMKTYNDSLTEKRYDDATESLQEYLQRYGASKAGKAHETEINSKIADAGVRKKKDREDEAKRLLALVKKDLAASSFESAGDIVARLTGEFSDTAFVKSNENQIKTYKKVCDDRAKQPSHVVVEMDFEDYPGTWNFRGGASGGNAFEEPYQGRRAARLTLPSGSYVYHPLPTLPARAESISFFVRARSKTGGGMAGIYFHDEGQMNTAIFGYEFPLTTEWKQVKFSFSELKPNNVAAKNKKEIDVTKISAFQLESAGSSNQVLDLQFDTLRIEALKPGK